MVRQVTPEALVKSVSLALSRLACEIADPSAAERHDHAACLHDEQAYVADMILHLVHVIATGDEGAMLDALDTVASSVKRDGS